MQIKRSIEKIPGGMMLVPLFLGALCHTFSPGAGIIHQRDDYRYGAHSGGVVFLHGGVNKIKRDGNGTA
ncbi:2-keto-3-deoxygluconate permease [Shigella flexneri 2a]|nr:2-keto-3-deoxygluconate permease [Shigella flexneri 2a]